MSFNRLLKEASAEAKDDYSPLPPREAKGAKGGATPPLDAAAAAELVNLVSEYLFDLFDANLMDEFLALEKFEVDCADEFDPDAEEFTFAQERLHREFVGMMEGYVEAYIAGLGRSLDDFYEAVRLQRDEESQGGSDARECVEVLFEMADIAVWAVWATGMRARARHRRLEREAPKLAPPRPW